MDAEKVQNPHKGEQSHLEAEQKRGAVYGFDVFERAVFDIQIQREGCSYSLGGANQRENHIHGVGCVSCEKHGIIDRQHRSDNDKQSEKEYK